MYTVKSQAVNNMADVTDQVVGQGSLLDFELVTELFRPSIAHSTYLLLHHALAWFILQGSPEKLPQVIKAPLRMAKLLVDRRWLIGINVSIAQQGKSIPYKILQGLFCCLVFPVGIEPDCVV